MSYAILEEHEILQIAENLQDSGKLSLYNKSTEDIAKALATLIQSRLDDLVNPDELVHLFGFCELARSLSNLPDVEEEKETEMPLAA